MQVKKEMWIKPKRNPTKSKKFFFSFFLGFFFYFLFNFDFRSIVPIIAIYSIRLLIACQSYLDVENMLVFKKVLFKDSNLPFFLNYIYKIHV